MTFFNKNLAYSLSCSIIFANAGRVINTPIVTPTIVVNANPFKTPAPINQSGNIATSIVKYAAKMMKNARFIRSTHNSSTDLPRITSSAMTI